LQWVQGAVFISEALNGQNVLSSNICNGYQATANGRAINVHNTGTALTDTTAESSAR